MEKTGEPSSPGGSYRGYPRGITPVGELPTYRECSVHPRERWGEPSEVEKQHAADDRRRADEHSRQLFADRAQRRRDFEVATLQRELAKLRAQLSPAAPDDLITPAVAPGDAEPEPLAIDFPNPSAPLTKRDAADAWGGAMTVKKLTRLMETGRVRSTRLSRQSFVFCGDDVPNLPKR